MTDVESHSDNSTGRRDLVTPGKLRDDRGIDTRNSMNAFNPAHFRAQFPALADAGVYLDSAATA
ncbi:hypothetical protein ACQT30_26155, partial [Klebsiella pneumoniae]